MLLVLMLFCFSNKIKAVQLSGSYTIDSTQTPSVTVFRNLQSAITYLTSADARSDGGPSNSAPFGVSGPVTFTFVAGTVNYVGQVVIPNIIGANNTNRVVINGNGNVLQALCTAAAPAIIRFSNADYVTLQNLTIRSLDVTNAWGIHFTLGSDSNIVENCNIEITSVTSTSSTSSAGIVFSNSNTSPTTSGANGYRNIIRNNTIKGHPTSGGMYYGIVGFPATSGTIISRNQFINNTIENFFNTGIYWGNSNGTLFRKNMLRRPTKTTLTTTYAFNLNNSSRNDTFDNNTITNLFGGSPTNANTMYAFWMINYNGTTTEPNIFYNNLVYDNKGNGPQNGVYILSSFNCRFYNNTFSFDNTANTSTTSTIYGVYLSSGTSTSSLFDFRNNIISITAGGIGPKFSMFNAGSFLSGATINKNDYYSNSLNYNMISHSGVVYPTYATWKSFIGTIDQNSSDVAPLFTNTATVDLRPRDAWFDGNGDNFAFITTDYTNTPRTTPFDIGAFEANPIPLDVAFNSVNVPAAPYLAGAQTITATIRNAGSTVITSATINWSINGVPQTPVPFTGSLGAGAVSTPISLGTLTVAQGTIYNISASVSNPNSGVDAFTTNNSASARTASALPGGIYTINSAGTGVNNFTSVVSFADLISLGGITGAITANIVPNSGPYTGQVLFTKALGSSNTNTITINGNGNTIQANPTATDFYVMMLNGADYMRLNNFTIRTLNISQAIGLHFMNRADSNIVDSVIVDFGNTILSSQTAHIAFSGSSNSATTSNSAHNGIRNIIRNCRLLSNPTGGPFYSFSIYGGSTDASILPSANQFINNEIIDPYTYGFFCQYTGRDIIRNNRISQPNRTSTTTFYGIYNQISYFADTIENNQIFDIFKSAPTTTNQAFGIYFNSAFLTSSAPGVVRNNLIYNFNGAGVWYGIYSGFTYNLHCYNNTISFINPTSIATGITYGFYNTTANTTHNYNVRNNIFAINRGGTANKFGIWINTAVTTSPTTFVFNNNAYFLSGTNTFVGNYLTTTFPTLANWKTANSSAFDQASVFANPNFRNGSNPSLLQPSNDTLDNVGFSLPTLVPMDITGALRSSTPDIGAFEFIVPGADAGIVRLLNPTTTRITAFTSIPIDVTIKNFGKSVLTNANIGWRVDTTTQTPTSYFGSLNTGDTAVQSVGFFTAPANGVYAVKVWTEAPNGVIDSLRDNDTINFTLCTPISGTVSINPALPASASNYKTFNALMQVLQNCGVDGPLTVTVAPGIYNEQVTLTSILGAGLASKVTFLGSDSATCRIVHNGSVQRATLLLNGAKNVEFKNLTFEGTNSAGATAVQLINGADSNSFTKCTFRVPIVNSTAVNAFVASASIISNTTLGNSANYTLIDSCTSVGGNYGITFFGNLTPKLAGNTIRNSTITNASNYGIYMGYQNGCKVTRNNVNNTGIVSNVISPFAIYLGNSDNANRIEGNNISAQLGGYGIYALNNLGSTTSTMALANNMIQIGAAANTTYGVAEINNKECDIAYNTVRLTTAEANYAGAAFYSSINNTALYNNVRIFNNIFTSPLGALSVYFVNGANLSPGLYSMNNNVYFSTSGFPFRIGGFITASLLTFVTGTPNMLGTFLPGSNANSQFVNPIFFSASNLRSIDPVLSNGGSPLANVIDDIDGKLRNATTPDIGVSEFEIPANDAGVVTILSPQQPLVPGLNDIKVLIKNFGTANLTNVNVNYKVGTSTTVTLPYSGFLAPNAVDTVTFTATSGVGSTSQQYNFVGTTETIKSWTSSPNSVLDSVPMNDSAQTTLCGGLAGVYTINPTGTGTSNFTSFQAVVDKLTCGGVFGPVVFNIAPGTYTGQINLPVIVGTSAINTITFQSSTGLASSVIITSATATASANYTIQTTGTQFVSFKNITIQNTNTSFGRVISLIKFAANNTNTNNIEVRNCILNGVLTTSTSDVFSIVFSPAGEYATFLSFVGNTFNNGSMGVSLGGQNIVNLATPNLIIDSNLFNNQYYIGINLSNRAVYKIRNNRILLATGNTFNYGINSVTSQNDCEILRNTIINPTGTYGISINQHAYYAASGPMVISNNAVHLQASANTTYGTYVVNSSSVFLFNNTFRSNSSLTNYGVYMQGNASFVNGTTTYPASNNLRLMNNVLSVSAGIPLFMDAIAKTGTSTCDNNLYFTTGATIATISAVNYATFASMKGMVYVNSDAKSLSTNIAFSTIDGLRPDTTSASSWYVNGRGGFIPTFLNIPSFDITGKPISTAVNTGATDIGAYQITPTSLPPLTTVTGSIGFGNTQYFIDMLDTVGSIYWDFSGLLPTSIAARYYTGSLINNPTAYGIFGPASYLDEHWNITATGGSGYSYNVNFKYEPNRLGTVPSETDIKLAKKDDASSPWMHYSFTTALDTLVKTFGASAFSTSANFTGTYDLSPLPVKMVSFNALRKDNNALLTWTTVQERNASVFEIQRSVDNKKFVKIGVVNAVGNSNKLVNYSFIDKDVVTSAGAKVVYYRLKTIDVDASSETSIVKVVNFNSDAKGSIATYPNPFTNELNITINAATAGTADVLLYDLFGKIVYQKQMQVDNGDTNLKVDELSNLPKGFYVIKVLVNDNEFVEKLIKE